MNVSLFARFTNKWLAAFLSYALSAMAALNKILVCFRILPEPDFLKG
jgi:hypothetical protein